MKIIIAVIMLITLASCAEYRAIVGSKGAEAADAALHDGEWVVCKASTAGALERRYSLYSDSEGPKAVAWKGLCYGVND